MGDFLSDLKDFMISEKIDNACGYYATILQSKDQLKDMINDCNRYFADIQYDPPDAEEYYTKGSLRIYLYKESTEDESCGSGYVMDSILDHYYDIDLGSDERDWGYCECTPRDAEYDPVHNCCGNGCDWSAPLIQVQKIHNILYRGFKGVERDMWALEDSWNKSDKELKRKIVLQQVKSLEEKIAELEKRKDLLLDNK